MGKLGQLKLETKPFCSPIQFIFQYPLASTYNPPKPSSTPKPLPAGVAHHLIFAHKRNSARFGESDDHVVTVSSQLRWEAQRNAYKRYGFDASHTGILESSRLVEIVNEALADVR